MNIVKLFQDYNIAYASETDRHYREGWINTPCPFCKTDNPGNHLGFPENGHAFVCWRCGVHSLRKTIAKLLHVDESEAHSIIKKYHGIITHTTEEIKRTPRKKSHRLPSNTEKLTEKHYKYLIKRGYDAEKIERVWGLRGTGTFSKLDNLDFKHRIIAPIHWDNKQVSFQSRDITGKHALKYITCPEKRELIHHKHIIYCKQEKLQQTAICVEGITDVWRFGECAFATFGIKYTQKQLRLISKLFKRVAVIFDDEDQAIIQAKKLVSDLRFRHVDAFHIEIKGDPGSMSQDDANYLIKTIL